MNFENFALLLKSNSNIQFSAIVQCGSFVEKLLEISVRTQVSDSGVRLRCQTQVSDSGVRLRCQTQVSNSGVRLRCQTQVSDSGVTKLIALEIDINLPLILWAMHL